MMSSECFFLVCRRHIIDRLLEQRKCTFHISRELEELIPCRGEFDLSYLFLVLLPCLLLLHCQSLVLRELLDVDVHANIDIEGLAAAIR